MDSDGCPRRNPSRVARTTALLAITAFALSTTAAAQSAKRQSCRGLTDNILCMPLPDGWHKSVGFGHAGGPAAWMLAGDFRFQEDAAKHEGWPPVPPHRLLIGVGDFPVFSQWKHWRHVGRLSLPGRMAAKRLVTWHVRFEGRALFLGVRFGSRPDARARRLADERLASVRRTLK
jgi:hypothetical protein